MDFKMLHETQKLLDDRINEMKGLSGEDLMRERLLALTVEIGELANETRCFKFWSVKPPSVKPVILEELVDCLHFILSIGNYSGYKFTKDERTVDIQDSIQKDLTDLFNGFFRTVVGFQDDPTPDKYVSMWDYFLSIATKLNLTRNEVYQAYMEKNMINHQRQAEGY